MPDCRTPKRPIYATEGAAWANVQPGHVPYRCAAGHWHIAPRDEAMRHRMAGRS